MDLEACAGIATPSATGIPPSSSTDHEELQIAMQASSDSAGSSR